MAPQATLVVPTPTTSPAVSTHAAAKSGPKPFVPELLLIFLGICLAYTLSYILYRVVMARRRASQQDVPDTPDRGVSRFMNGARLTLSFGHKPAATPNLGGSSSTINKEKPSADTPSLPELPMPSPAESSLAVHLNQEIDQLLPQARDPTEVTSSFSAPPAPPSTRQPFAQRVAAKVNFLSNDRVEAIALDPKLAPVQGPVRPLSTVGRFSRKKRTSLFGLGLKHIRSRNQDPDMELGTR